MMIQHIQLLNLLDNEYINENNFDLMLVKNDDEELYARLKDKNDISSVETWKK